MLRSCLLPDESVVEASCLRWHPRAVREREPRTWGCAVAAARRTGSVKSVDLLRRMRGVEFSASEPRSAYVVSHAPNRAEQPRSCPPQDTYEFARRADAAALLPCCARGHAFEVAAPKTVWRQLRRRARLGDLGVRSANTLDSSPTPRSLSPDRRTVSPRTRASNLRI